MHRNLRYMFATALVVVGVGVFAATFARAVLFSSAEETAVIPHDQVAPGDYPVRLEIPSLGIDAHVQQTGLTKAGAMGVPTNFTDVAWYRYGPMPGQVGSAVMDGHVDNALSLPGVFKNLGNIQKGADVYVVTKSGERLHFVVEDTQTYPYTAAPKEFIFTRKDRARLNLITCEGRWVRDEKTYSDRLVVYAVLQDTSGGD